MLPLRATAFLLAVGATAIGALTASASTGDGYQVVFSLSDQTAARHVVLRSDQDLKIVPTDFDAISETPEACRGFNPRRRDLVVTGLATGAGTGGSVVDRVRVKVFRNAHMAHADWQRNAVAPAARRCRFAQLQSFGDLLPKARKVGLSKVARYQTAFLVAGLARVHHPGGTLPAYRWNVVLVEGRTEIELTVVFIDTKGNDSDVVADIAESLVDRVST